MSKLELGIPPLVLVAMAAAGMWAVAGLPADLPFAFPGLVRVAAGVAGVGAVIVVLGVRAFSTAGTTVDPRVPDQSARLVVDGVYRHSRNPMYLGFLLVLLAWGLFLGSALSLLFLPAFVLYLNRFQIVPEERFMQERFGEAYAQYRAEVRRWI
jgi:protein-S-isoprenylcysteine O-methyltransferase Ste14